MLLDILKMYDKEVRLFKRISLQTVDDILSNCLVFTPIHSFSSLSTTHSQMLFIFQDVNIYETFQFNTIETTNQNSSKKLS